MFFPLVLKLTWSTILLPLCNMEIEISEGEKIFLYQSTVFRVVH